MSKIKYFILLIVLTVAVPAFSIEDINDDYKSTNLTEMSDYTGENFFKSKFAIDEERKQETKNLEKEFNQKFHEDRNGAPIYNYNNRKVMPPLKKFRLGIVRAKDNFKLKHNEKKQKQEITVDANGVVEEKAEDVNEVLQEEANETQTMIKCHTMKYLPATNEMEATGNVEIKFPQQNTTMYADRMTYNTLSGIIQLYDNVKVVRDGKEVFGEYIKINTNEETSYLKKLKASENDITIIAENGYMFDDKIVAEKGKISSDAEDIISLRSNGFGEDLRRFIIPKEDLTFLFSDVDENKYVIKVNEIRVCAKDAHDKIQLKHPQVYSTKTGKKIFALPSMTFYTNKEHDYFEGNYPEIGSYSGFGMFAGPGLVLETPFGSTLKLMPTVNYKKHFGYGGVARFRSGTNVTSAAYNTAAERFLLNGYQRLDDHLTLQYGANSYIDNWFMGKAWVGYGGELLYENGYINKNFLYDRANATFRHRISAGVFRENARGHDNKYYDGYHRMSTARFKYMAEYNQTLYSLFGDEDTSKKNGWRQLDFNIISQGLASLYGTGDTQFIGRIGPNLTIQYKNWRQEAGYFLTGYSDNTPLTSFDTYRYGYSNVYLREYLRLHKFLTIGLYGSYDLSDDSYDFQAKKQTALKEASFYASIGPDDLKLNIGYDFVRQNTYFGVSVAMNTKGTTVDYDKIEIKNYEGLGKAKGEQNTVKFDEFVAPVSPYKSKAIVEDLEDASTYMRGEPL